MFDYETIVAYAIAFIVGGVIASAGVYKYMDARHQAYVSDVEAQYQKQLTDSKNKELQLVKANLTLQDTYNARLAAANSRIGKLRLAASSGPVSKDTAAAAGFNAAAADLIADPVTLLEACTKTTAIAKGLQEYAETVTNTINKE